MVPEAPTGRLVREVSPEVSKKVKRNENRAGAGWERVAVKGNQARAS